MVWQSLNGLWQFRQVGDDIWLAGEVPGGVHTDLLALDRIPDPFVEDNELAVQWVTESDWEYRRIFDVDPELLSEERVFLVCDGLDTLVDVSVNGALIAQADNMFRTYRWDVTSLLTSGANELHMTFASPVRYALHRQAERPLRSVTQAIPGGPYLRKVPSHFGWDWGPQLPAIGIFRDIRLEGLSSVRLADVRLSQIHAESSVRVSASVTVERFEGTDAELVLRLKAPSGIVQDAALQLSAGETCGVLELEVRDPQLWWPNGYGGQPLYGVEVLALEKGLIRDQRDFRIGLRTIELHQEPDEYGISFTFVVNGVPIFAKGANWIPADSFVTRMTDSRLEGLLRSAAAVHMNMLRVWGGGFYEDDRFYDLCDQYGILVWQDFIFSCSTYPEDPSFFHNVRAEAVDNVRRLRHHASLALWCGNNEMEWGWVEWGWSEEYGLSLKSAYDRLFHHVLPEVVAVEDPDRDYWPSSPSSNVPFDAPNSTQAGDTHNWLVWHGMLPFSGYREHPSRFVSEFGFQSLPALQTVRTYAGEADWNMTSYVMEHHQRNAAGNGKIVTYLTDHFRLPKDFESLVYVSQLLQAEALRYGVEFWRRNRACTSGALYWQLNDCWPVASWASLDYFGRWKAAHYAARRFFAPVLLSAEESGTDVELSITSDLTRPWQGVVRWSLEDLAGRVLKNGELKVDVPALGTSSICELSFADDVTAANRRDVILAYELWYDGVCASLGIVTFVPTKHLELDAPGLTWDVASDKDELVIRVSAERLARFVWLDTDEKDVVFSDNFFDLPAGRSVELRAPMVEGWSVESMRRALRVRSLVDSY
ncbi:MAG: glycoside hydrolase family 2 protein [Chloroflexi bacterium]|nr:glycoside hydrolase family 2 protein [Chloroflexota bacterium]